MPAIKEVMDQQLETVKFNNVLVNKIQRYRYDYLTSNPKNLEFFGNNLLGVIPLRYTERQVISYFDDVLEVDFYSISKALKKVESINQDFKVSSDVFNITIMYVMHRLLTSSISKTSKTQATRDMASIFYYRTLAALISHRFKYNADPAIVSAAYSNLNGKYLIKKLGSWNKVIEFRVDTLLGSSSKFLTDLTKFTDDDRILYAITDSQGSMKVLINNYFSEIVKAKDAGQRINASSSSITDIDGEDVLKDRLGNIETIISRLLTVMTDKDMFIKKDIINVIIDLNKNTNAEQLHNLLTWLQASYVGNYNKAIENVVRGSIVYANDFLTNNRPDIPKKDLSSILLAVRNSLASSRNRDATLKHLKTAIDKMIKKSKIRIVNSSDLSSTRTSLILYLFLMSILK